MTEESYQCVQLRVMDAVSSASREAGSTHQRFRKARGQFGSAGPLHITP